MFKEFFIKEIISALKRPMIYIFLLIITLMVFGAVASDNVVIGVTVGNVYKNAPHVITNYVAILSIFGLMIATAFFNNAALICSTISKFLARSKVWILLAFPSCV